MSRPTVAVLIAGVLLGLLSLQAVGMLGSWWPLLLVPAPIVLVIPLFMNLPVVVLPLIVVVAFWAWSYQLFRGAPHVPLRTVLLLPLVAVLSIAYFVSNWHYGAKYQGLPLTLSYALLSACFLVAASFALVVAKRTPSFARNLLVHALLFTWVLSYAFPYLGEWP